MHNPPCTQLWKHPAFRKNFLLIPNSQSWTNTRMKCDLALASTVKMETYTNSCNEDAKRFSEKQRKLVIGMFRQGFPILESDSYPEKS